MHPLQLPFLRTCALFPLLAFAFPAHGEIIGLEQFDYPNGPIAGKSGGFLWDLNNVQLVYTGTPSSWVNTNGQPVVSNGRLETHDSGARRAYNGDEIGGAINDPTSEPSSVENAVYYRATVTTGDSVPTWFGFSSYDLGNERLFFGKGEGASGFGVQILDGDEDFSSTTLAAPNTTYVLVAKIDFEANEVAFFIDPDFRFQEPEPDVSLDYTEVFWSTSVQLASGSGGAVTWDNLIVATTWENAGGTIVTSANDQDTGSLDGFSTSLREAIKYSPAGTLITFDPTLIFKTIFEGNTIMLYDPLIIDKSLVIDASDFIRGFTISGDGDTRLMEITPGNTVNLNTITLTDGNATTDSLDGNGGAIYNNQSTLTLTSCTLANNTAGNHGGGIYNHGGEGGSATLTLTNCTLTGNSAGAKGGGFFNGSVDGNAIISLTHCSIVENSAGNSGGGVFNDGSEGNSTLTISNSIVALNHADTGPDIRNDNGSVIAEDVNLLSNLDDSGLTEDPTLLVTDPELTSLKDNGGLTKTKRPKSGSPAINAATILDPPVNFDQRGMSRPFGTQPDLGAVEAYFEFVVDNLEDSKSPGSLRQAILLATSVSTITFDPSLSGETIKLLDGHLYIDKSLNIDASSLPGGITIDADNKSRVMLIDAGHDVSLDSLKLINGVVDFFSNGGGIYNSAASLTLTNCTVRGNYAGEKGGGIYTNANITLMNCTLSGNHATYGGGLYVDGRGGDGVTATLVNCTVAGNNSLFDGAGINNNGEIKAILTLTNCTVSGNYTDGSRGGGIYNNNYGGQADVTITNSIIAANSASGATGGDIANLGGRVFSEGVNLISDTSDNDLGQDDTVIVADPKLGSLGDNGGLPATKLPLPDSPAINAAMVLDSSPATDQRGLPRLQGPQPDIGAVETRYEFTVDTTDDSGPGSLREAVFIPDVGAVITFDPTLSGDTITLTSGQLLIDESLTIDASALPGGITIDGDNQSRVMKITPGHTVALDSLTLTGGNAAGSSPNDKGGAIYNDQSTLTLTRCTLNDNTAGNNGGAIFNNGRDGATALLTLTDCTLFDNSADDDGAAIYNDGRDGGTAALTLTNCTITGNTAGLSGGGFYNSGFDGTATLLLTHCTVTGNSAETFNGGGVFNDSFEGSSTLTIANSIIAANSAPNGPDIRNNSGTVIPEGVNLLSTLMNSDLSQGPSVLVAADPLLGQLGDYGGPTATMRPRVGSPAVNAAEASAAPLTTDQRGDARPNGPQPDIGAVEAKYMFTVENSGDSGPGSLRESILSVDTGAIITFDSALSGEAITLTSGQLLVDKSLTIDASALPGGITIDADGQSRVMKITPGHTVALDFLTLTGGNATGTFPDDLGGAIYNDQSTLTLTHCTLAGNTTSNSGGAIFNSGSSGGSATLSLNACTLSGNSANADGGAIYNDGRDDGTATLTLTNCTLTGNAAGASGGAFHNAGLDGNAILSLTHCTVTGNTGETKNGGGVFNDSFEGNSTLTITNSIIAANTAPTGPDIRNNNGTVIAEGVNLFSTLSDSSLSQGTSALVAADLHLVPLGEYGGPTATMPPLSKSPAINAATLLDPPLATDQRGISRPFGPHPDIGAVEARLAATVENTADSGPGSLRETILLADPSATITFSSGLIQDTITLTSGQLLIDKPLTIDASGWPTGITIDADENSRVMMISPGHEVHLVSLTLTGGKVINSSGGAIFNHQSILTLTACTLHGNSAGNGGGIFNLGQDGHATLTLKNCTLAGNSGDFGGAILNLGFQGNATLALTHCTLTGNSAVLGGGIYNFDHDTNVNLTLTNSIIAANNADASPDVFNGRGIVIHKGTNLLSVLDHSGLSQGPDILVAANPLLAPLGDYTGPTATLHPLPGSPAINAAAVLDPPLTTDQRGFPRPNGPLPDIGAVEAYPLSQLNLADSDNDGIPDILKGPGSPYPQFTLGQDDSALDSDGDGRTDAQELAAMTNPLDPNDYFRILSFEPAPGFHPQDNPIFDITVKTFPGMNYVLESDPDLTEPFEPLEDGAFTATDVTETLRVELRPGREFIRARTAR